MSEEVQNSVVEDVKQEPEAVAAPPEKMVPQSVFAAAVSAERAKAYEKGKREGLAGQLPVQPMQTASHAQAQPIAGNENLTVEQRVQNIFQQERQKAAADQAEAKRIQDHNNLIDQFAGKIHASENKYPGLSSKLKDMGLENMMHIVHLANTVENTADVMHDLHQNPQKLVHFDFLIKNSPQTAWTEMGGLSNMLKVNHAAEQQKNVNIEPLDQMTPSNTNSADNGSYGKNVDDFKGRSWAKV